MSKTVNDVMFSAAVARAKEAGDFATNEEWAILYADKEITVLREQLAEKQKKIDEVMADLERTDKRNSIMAADLMRLKGAARNLLSDIDVFDDGEGGYYKAKAYVDTDLIVALFELMRREDEL